MSLVGVHKRQRSSAPRFSRSLREGYGAIEAFLEEDIAAGGSPAEESSAGDSAAEVSTAQNYAADPIYCEYGEPTWHCLYSPVSASQSIKWLIC